jgi:hypothetical protein
MEASLQHPKQRAGRYERLVGQYSGAGKTDKPGIDLIVARAQRERRCTFGGITESGVNDLVYNDFFIGEGSDIDIVRRLRHKQRRRRGQRA